MTALPRPAGPRPGRPPLPRLRETNPGLWAALTADEVQAWIRHAVRHNERDCELCRRGCALVERLVRGEQ